MCLTRIRIYIIFVRVLRGQLRLQGARPDALSFPRCRQCASISLQLRALSAPGVLQALGSACRFGGEDRLHTAARRRLTHLRADISTPRRVQCCVQSALAQVDV